MNSFIKVENLTKVYTSLGQKVLALSGVNLTVSKSEFIAVAGPSGSGKSTLLHIIGGLDSPTKGKALIAGKDLSSLTSADSAYLRNRRIGFVFQFYRLINELSVIENVILPALIAGDSFPSALKKAEDLLNRLGLLERSRFMPQNLSGGEQQRTAIARALINRPEILLCDEPTGNLDSKSAERIKELLNEIHTQYNTTIILVTHNLELAKNAQRVLNIRNGELIN